MRDSVGVALIRQGGALYVGMCRMRLLDIEYPASAGGIAIREGSRLQFLRENSCWVW